MSLETKKLREKTIEDLNKMVKDLNKDIQEAVSGLLHGSDKDTGKARRLRKDIARIKTVISEKMKVGKQ